MLNTVAFQSRKKPNSYTSTCLYLLERSFKVRHRGANLYKWQIQPQFLGISLLDITQVCAVSERISVDEALWTVKKTQRTLWLNVWRISKQKCSCAEMTGNGRTVLFLFVCIHFLFLFLISFLFCSALSTGIIISLCFCFLLVYVVFFENEWMGFCLYVYIFKRLNVTFLAIFAGICMFCTYLVCLWWQ